MGKEIFFKEKGIRIQLSQDEYTNCHQFTLETIQALVNNSFERLSETIGPYIKDIINTSSLDPNQLRTLYTRMSQDAQATILKQNNCANIDGIQLVLFMDLGGTLQHSMLIIQRNIWIGANNLFSLGAGDEKIQVYYDMSNRTHVDGKRGGWNRDGFMSSILNKGEQSYNLHCIPIIN